MRIVCATQNTAEWYDARLGNCTGSAESKFNSRLKKASKNGKAGEWSGAHWEYVRELAWERITGVPADHYVSNEMDIGKQYEGEARVEFWMRRGTEVEQTGFILHPNLPFLGSSPDGYVIENGIWIPVELKVPKPKTHEKYLEDDVVPEEYVGQLDTEMLCMDRAPYGYFASYCPPDIFPTMPDEFRLFVKRQEANPERWVAIEEAAHETMLHVAERMEKLRRMYPAKGSPKSKLATELAMSHEALAASEMTDDPMSPGYSFLDEREMVP